MKTKIIKKQKLNSFFILFLLLIISSGMKIFPQTKSSVDTTDIFRSIKFRNIGPAIAGGRVTSVVGIPGNSKIYYIGAAAGGVFKTTNGGFSWKAIFKKQPVASIGAIALAPSNPNLIWVGTGEANLRTDISTGKGVYFSPDAGTAWKFMGLKNAGQISKIIINPSNPNIVFVAVVGHAWAPNKERGLFKTTNGGKTWKKVLYVNNTTGVTDVAFQPGNPMVMLAATWQVIRRPWKLIDGGKGSAIYKSVDGGNTWKKITKGIPKGPLGRIALGVSPSKPDHVYALIESKTGVLFDSQNFGNSWKKVNNNHELNVRPFYFSTMEVAPNNDQKIYFLSFMLTVSTNGGKTVKKINRGMHVDHHAIWIDSKNPNRVLVGNDGGVYLSMNGGINWKYFDNIPIEQFYQVATDTLLAYHIGGGLQDNNGWYGPSRNLHGSRIDGFNWFVVAGGDGEYVVPAPSNPNIIYSESQDGWINRLNTKTGLSSNIRPYIPDAPSVKTANLKYRFNWTTPIAVSFNDANTVYIGANVLFKSINGGQKWEVISPDLTRNDKIKQQISGGPVEYDISGAENYDTILSIALSKKNENVIWVGTDDGLIQVTRDGGKTWKNVTKNIPNLPEWGRIYQIEVSPFSPSVCYAAIDFHMLDNNKPYIYKTTNFGRSWEKITKSLPQDEPVHVVREDPNKQGFLVAGTETGLYFSNNDGKFWKPLKSNFPTAPVWDLKFVKKTHDIVVATHGRGLFVLDNITPIENTSKKIQQKAFYFYKIMPAYFFHIWRKGGFNDASKYSAPNPPTGAVIDYYLKTSIKQNSKDKKMHKTPVRIKITDENGAFVDSLYGTSHNGVNRVVWNLRYRGAQPLITKISGVKKPYMHRGPRVLPGTYNVFITVNGKTYKNEVIVKHGPYVPFNLNTAKAQLKASLKLRGELSVLNKALNRIENLKLQLKNIQKSIKATFGSKPNFKNNYGVLFKKAHKLDSLLTSLKNSMYNSKIQKGVGEDDIHYLSKFHQWFRGMMYSVTFAYNSAPSVVQKNRMIKLVKLLKTYVQRFNSVISVDVPEFNKVAKNKNAPILLTGSLLNLK